MAFSEHWADCEQITGTTAETIALNAVNYLRIDSNINDVVYIVLNWTTGDTEVSAANFNIALRAYEVFEFKQECPSAPKLFNIRVISATTGYLGIIGW